MTIQANPPAGSEVERTDLVTPRPGGVRETVQHQHERPVPRLEVGEAQAVRLDRALANRRRLGR